MSKMEVQPCGIYCPKCPRYLENKCSGSENCRKCKSIYHCAKEKGFEFCFQCNSRVNFPCARFKKFAETWKKYGQDLIDNQNYIQSNGVKEFIKKMEKSKGE